MIISDDNEDPPVVELRRSSITLVGISVDPSLGVRRPTADTHAGSARDTTAM
jgi:hypothetical protein